MSSARTRKLLSMHSQKSTLASRANCEHLCRRRKWPSASSRTSLGQPPQARASKKSPKSHSVRMQNGQNVIFLPFSPLALTDQRSRVQSPCSTGNHGNSVYGLTVAFQFCCCVDCHHIELCATLKPNFQKSPKMSEIHFESVTAIYIV